MVLPFDGLIKFTAGVTLVGCTSLYFVRWSMQKYVRESVWYKEAMELAQNNKNILEVLGEPIKATNVNVGNKECYSSEGDTMWVKVPLEGSKRKGFLRYFVTVDDPITKKNPHLSKMEFNVAGSDNTITLDILNKKVAANN